ncbi:NAD-dependent epimerase/dehydratase family protein [uncultured Bacteroides sp.]|jgi:UDP-glucose 4-epimerase|uniref:NAD-dependent epimerase/dehydratase family protein n=1 Tax=uncultured Bacteroides sp. TaxID=162156 RepID=UPI00033C2C77|nr:NAD-dependent epimerase/dehydratase family protein [uncultured Bacteroides sp.]CDA84101.1 nucleoside-diphosphate-sugar epimerase [Bacteroides sp. CAG:754]
MKILIIGKNSYIGNHIDEWLTRKEHKVEQLDVLTEDWRAYDYSSYDAIVHVAGIVHRPDCKDWELYRSVNTDLPIEIAKLFKDSSAPKAQNSSDSWTNQASQGPSANGSTLEQLQALNNGEALNQLNSSSAALSPPKGTKTFVFFSTMGVYDTAKMLKPCVVDGNTPLHSKSMYGKSKLLAEQGLLALQSSNGSNCLDGLNSEALNSSFTALNQLNNCPSGIEPAEGTAFNVAIVRPPSVYGKGCRGSYITGFTTIARKLPIIPCAYENVRQSFVYIDNLSECVRVIIESNLSGIFCPQDDEIPNANRLLEVICKGIGKKYRSSKFLGLCLRMVSFIPLVKKAYGGIEYERELSEIAGYNYQVVSFEEGMRRTIS